MGDRCWLRDLASAGVARRSSSPETACQRLDTAGVGPRTRGAAALRPASTLRMSELVGEEADEDLVGEEAAAGCQAEAAVGALEETEGC